MDSTLLGGGTVILQDQFDAAATLAAIETERITDLFLVEPQLFELMDHPGVADHDLSSLRTLVHIGAAAAPVLRRRARERLGAVIAHTYGASEMGIVSALSPAEHDLARPERFACAGRILPDVEVRFRAEGGGLHPTHGRIEVRSPDMASGYRHRPVEEAANFVDGWYRPGDLGHLDDDGYPHINGRAADCAEIEGRLVTPAAGSRDTRRAVDALPGGSISYLHPHTLVQLHSGRGRWRQRGRIQLARIHDGAERQPTPSTSSARTLTRGNVAVLADTHRILGLCPWGLEPPCVRGAARALRT